MSRLPRAGINGAGVGAAMSRPRAGGRSRHMSPTLFARRPSRRALRPFFVASLVPARAPPLAALTASRAAAASARSACVRNRPAPSVRLLDSKGHGRKNADGAGPCTAQVWRRRGRFTAGRVAPAERRLVPQHRLSAGASDSVRRLRAGRAAEHALCGAASRRRLRSRVVASEAERTQRSG